MLYLYLVTERTTGKVHKIAAHKIDEVPDLLRKKLLRKNDSDWTHITSIEETFYLGEIYPNTSKDDKITIG